MYSYRSTIGLFIQPYFFMEIYFEYNDESVRRSIDILRPFLPGIPESMHFRYPEELLAGKDNSSVIENDDHLYDASNMKNALAYLWREKRNVLSNALVAYCEKGGISLYEEYSCAMTFYGPYGFYELPCNIFLNVAMGKDVEFLFETMLHELLHIVLNNQLENLPYVEREKMVDNTFVKIWGDEFPSYEKQLFE
ncbi:MAG: hypothetical protein COZ86_03700 [Candidatus Moranbacteria bacterium CG_4_8_14_3_um_filter_41_13]|nr:MAG: hypothetical protein AUK58_03305 [Candidatus Moranbacteria bacterium CG2_30_41_165]PIV86560.1 MAG: hypothetical protein COW50_00555 [Candidatus Moranbacteria bacterium CG17_big_fil_post_rev_8_21_14_2_50_41_107]PIW93944.1 MAG: hypothetical protein COZ86_03700 [Candidatus Moranbacteria bacterium CG_4_8_14_3_um_filter_41_13]PJB99889.1 MAG: hypothetical protein CO075_03475 [Candidatus Moranbacteria bacterium CG_4_9_14_0_8_um_filter_41_43]